MRRFSLSRLAGFPSMMHEGMGAKELGKESAKEPIDERHNLMLRLLGVLNQADGQEGDQIRVARAGHSTG